MSSPGFSPFAPPVPVPVPVPVQPPSPHDPGPYVAAPYSPVPYPPLPYAPAPYAPAPYAPAPYAPAPYVAPSAAQVGQLGAGYQGSSYLRTAPPRTRRPRRAWIPLLCIGLVLVLAIGAGVVTLVGKVTAPGTFTDLDGVVTVQVPGGWADETGPNPAEVDADGLSAPNLVVVDYLGDTSIVVWIFPPVPADELSTSHTYSLEDSCPDGVTCAEDGPPSATTVDDRPAQTSVVRVAGGVDEDPYVMVLATILAPRHLVLVEIASYDGVSAADLRALLDGVTVDR